MSREMIKMVVVLTVLSSLSGGLLAALRDNTALQIEEQVLKFEKAPTLKVIYEGSTNDPIADRFKAVDTTEAGEVSRDFYVGKFEDKGTTVALDTFGPGYGGDIGMIVAINPADDTIVGVGVTTHKETPGLGALAKTDKKFAAQFKGMPIDKPFKVKADPDGQVDALSGATITSRGVAAAVTNACEVYKRMKPQLVEELKKF